MSIMGGIQPGVLNEILARGDFKDNGFITRYIWVPSIKKVRAKYENAKAIPDNVTQLWYDAVAFFQDIKEYQFTLSAEASQAYANYYNGNSYEDDEVIREINGKCEINAMRIAIIMHLMLMYERYRRVGNCSGMDEITLADMQAAISIAELAALSCLRVISQIKERKTWTKKDAICAMYANGVKQADIARVLEVSRQYVSTVVGA